MDESFKNVGCVAIVAFPSENDVLISNLGTRSDLSFERRERRDLEMTGPATSHIGTLNEKPLHAALKQWYARPGDQFEVRLDGYFIDIVREEELIEIQTRNLGALRGKLKKVLANHPVTLVYPVAESKWIVKHDKRSNGTRSRRKSPKHGSILTAFEELVSIPRLLIKPGLKLVIALIEEEEHRQHDPRRAWRRKGWVVEERRLLNVLDSCVLDRPQDYMDLLPGGLPEHFTTADLSKWLKCTRQVAQQVAYCFHKMSYIERVGKKGRYYLYRKNRDLQLV